MTAAVLAAVVFFAVAALPPRPRAVDATRVDPNLVGRTVRGAYHIHTTRSDGAADKAEVAAAASRAGLRFIILTDHGDGTRPSDPPAYLSGVLCIDGVEISTNGGHYVALGMRPSPYPLGGDPAAVVEDVARLGGFGVAAHPDSPKASLGWTDWEAPIDALEWLSADSEWRDESRTTLGRVFMAYLLRPGPALATMLDRPVTLKRWDELTGAGRRVVALAAHDAHGGIGRGIEETGERRRTLGHIPSYEASFRTFSDNVVLDAPLSGDAADDARRVLNAIRTGRVFTVIDAIATPGSIQITQAPASISVRAAAPDAAEVVMFVDGHGESGRWRTADLTAHVPDGATAVRFEIQLPADGSAAVAPWLLSNFTYVRAPAARTSGAADTEPVGSPVAAVWHVEKDPRSVASVRTAPGQASLEYTLAPGARASQFAALAADTPAGLGGARQLVFAASAAGPSRVSVQLRYAQRGGERWGSSAYLDARSRTLVLPLDRMHPLDRQSGSAPDPAGASSLLFVVDLTNARPADSGRFTIADLRTAR